MKAPRPLRSRASSTRLTGFPIQLPCGADFPGKVRSFSPPARSVSSRARLAPALLGVERQHRDAVARGLLGDGDFEVGAGAGREVAEHVADVGRAHAAGGVEGLDA